MVVRFVNKNNIGCIIGYFIPELPCNGGYSVSFNEITDKE